MRMLMPLFKTRISRRWEHLEGGHQKDVLSLVLCILSVKCLWKWSLFLFSSPDFSHHNLCTFCAELDCCVLFRSWGSATIYMDERNLSWREETLARWNFLGRSKSWDRNCGFRKWTLDNRERGPFFSLKTCSRWAEGIVGWQWGMGRGGDFYSNWVARVGRDPMRAIQSGWL